MNAAATAPRRFEKVLQILDLDAGMDLRVSRENALVTRAYHDRLGAPGSPEAHRLLHTRYSIRRRSSGDAIALTGEGGARVPVSVCVGTGCHLRGSQQLLKALMRHVEEAGLEDRVSVQATFCLEACDRGPTVRVAGQVLHRAGLEAVTGLLDQALSAEAADGAR